MPAPVPACPSPPARLLHVACLNPLCGHDAVLDPVRTFGAGPYPEAGLSGRFRCLCGRRTTVIAWVARRPRRMNGCGWF